MKKDILYCGDDVVHIRSLMELIEFLNSVDNPDDWIPVDDMITMDDASLRPAAQASCHDV